LLASVLPFPVTLVYYSSWSTNVDTLQSKASPSIPKTFGDDLEDDDDEDEDDEDRKADTTATQQWIYEDAVAVIDDCISEYEYEYEIEVVQSLSSPSSS
jgi:hypothetical protein